MGNQCCTHDTKNEITANEVLGNSEIKSIRHSRGDSLIDNRNNDIQV